MARPLKIAWKHLVEVFYQLYKRRLDTRIAKRWPALWVLRRGERWKRVKEMGVQPQADSAGVQGVAGDQAVFPKGKAVEEGGRPTLLSPAERVFEAVRRWVGGRRYEHIEVKKAAGEGVPRGLEARGRSPRW